MSWAGTAALCTHPSTQTSHWEEKTSPWASGPDKALLCCSTSALFTENTWSCSSINMVRIFVRQRFSILLTYNPFVRSAIFPYFLDLFCHPALPFQFLVHLKPFQHTHTAVLKGLRDVWGRNMKTQISTTIPQQSLQLSFAEYIFTERSAVVTVCKHSRFCHGHIYTSKGVHFQMFLFYFICFSLCCFSLIFQKVWYLNQLLFTHCLFFHITTSFASLKGDCVLFFSMRPMHLSS